MNLIVSEWGDFRAKCCRWISMQTVAPFYPKFAISQTKKSQGRSVLQYSAEQDSILISKKFLFWSLNSRFGLFLAFF